MCFEVEPRPSAGFCGSASSEVVHHHDVALNPLQADIENPTAVGRGGERRSAVIDARAFWQCGNCLHPVRAEIKAINGWTSGRIEVEQTGAFIKEAPMKRCDVGDHECLRAALHGPSPDAAWLPFRVVHKLAVARLEGVRTTIIRHLDGGSSRERYLPYLKNPDCDPIRNRSICRRETNSAYR